MAEARGGGLESIAVCLTWAESMAAFAQRSRFKAANQPMLAKAKSAFEKAWQGFAIAEVSQPLVEKAGLYAEVFALRGYDSVLLAAAHSLHQQLSLPLTFACFDRRRNQAAQLLQLEVLS